MSIANTARIPSLIFGCAIVFCATSAMATENGALNQPIGLNTIGSGFLPQPGKNFIQNYSVYYKANEYTNAAGDSAVPGFDAEVAVNATRFIHTWDVSLGPFQFASGGVVTFLHTDVSTAFGGDVNRGVGDFMVQPFTLGWQNEQHTFFSNFAVNFFMPSRTDVSTNYYSIDPVYAFTWFPSQWLEATGSLAVEFPLQNSETDYQSGITGMMDWGLTAHPVESVPELGVGLSGYVVYQLTDDKQSGQTVGDGNKQRAIAIGPQIAYGNVNGGIALKWQHEFYAESRAKGDRYWLQWTVAF